MKYFPSALTTDESNALASRIQQHFAQHGFGLWAVEIAQVTPFAGFIGLAIPRFEAHFTPCVEIGWRLWHAYWGHGYATEGATAALHFAFCSLSMQEVVAMTTTSNLPSRRVMERIGMTRSPEDDFDHPLLPANHPLLRHVLYRIRREIREGAGDVR
jgi:RimJ/RimL family protein N-acetyltransferase